MYRNEAIECLGNLKTTKSEIKKKELSKNIARLSSLTKKIMVYFLEHLYLSIFDKMKGEKQNLKRLSLIDLRFSKVVLFSVYLNNDFVDIC